MKMTTRCSADVGGRLDVSKGWTLNIPGPGETGGALSRAMSTQGDAAKTAVPTTAPSVVAMNDASKDALQ